MEKILLSSFKRKSFLLLLSLILVGKCFSQGTTSQVFHLDSIPSQSGVILNKGWKFHSGDDPQWAKVGYDDATWQSVDPTLGLHNLQIVKKAGIGWFRLKIKVDSSLMNETIAMELNTQGASEIYLNGALIYRFGVVSSDFKEEQTRVITNRPFSLKLGDQPLQELAIRYSYHRKNLYLNIRRAFCMQLILKENNNAFADYIRSEGFLQNLRSIQLSFYLPLGFLLLFLYYSYRLQKEYLYIGIFSFCMFLGMLMGFFAFMETRTVNEANFYFLLNQLLLVFGLVFLLHGTYILLKLPKSRYYYCILSYAILIFPPLFVFYDSHILIPLFIPLVIIELLRCSLKAFRQRRPGALILVITAIICLLAIIGMIAFKIMGWSEVSNFLYTVCYIIPPLGLSLFFAGEFARTGESLQSRVAEIEKLSQKTIVQEKEKQQILASQNITLETQVKERTAELIQERQALEIEKEAKLLAEFNRKFSESELKALRSQMNPHFVFNILNTIESFALENNKEGVSAMIQKFSRLTRIVLENSMNQLVPFQNDWRSLQLYVELEQMRYADDFRVVYNMQDQILDGEYFIPPMIIQPFVENAIIHGLRNRADQYGILNLSARLQNEYIIVEVKDNGIGRIKAAELKGNNSIQKKSLGIKLTQDRISIFNNLKQNKKVNLEIEDLPEGTKVTIAMPAN